MRRFGIIGRPLGHSRSADYFTEKFGREGLDAEYRRYELATIEEFAALSADIEGFNVTIPYKQAVMAYLDALSPEAEGVGAVNCIACRDGRKTGYNTDLIGIRRTLDTLLGDEESESIGQALVLGTGGASKAVQYALAERNIPFDIVSRDPSRGNITYGELTAQIIKEHRLIINATPVGMAPNTEDAPALPYGAIESRHLLFDLVYNPPLTRFLRYGKEAGAAIVGGQDMFVAQAEASWRIWNGEQA